MGRRRRNLDEFIGRQFGELKITGYGGFSPDNRSLVRAVCSCSPEVEKNYVLDWLTRKTQAQRSCGCLKKQAFLSMRDGEIERLPIEIHVAIWDAAQANSSVNVWELSKRFSVWEYVIRPIVAGIQDVVCQFVEDCDKQDWLARTRSIRARMRASDLREFRVGRSPRLKADRRFKKAIIDPALDLMVNYQMLEFCRSEPVRSRFMLVKWVLRTYELTIDGKRFRRKEKLKQLKLGKEFAKHPERDVPEPWKSIYSAVGIE